MVARRFWAVSLTSFFCSRRLSSRSTYLEMIWSDLFVSFLIWLSSCLSLFSSAGVRLALVVRVSCSVCRSLTFWRAISFCFLISFSYSSTSLRALAFPSAILVSIFFLFSSIWVSSFSMALRRSSFAFDCLAFPSFSFSSCSALEALSFLTLPAASQEEATVEVGEPLAFSSYVLMPVQGRMTLPFFPVMAPLQSMAEPFSPPNEPSVSIFLLVNETSSEK
mmetsp:Transcript_45745/g.76367  ORF Transcript_45745/g.76367 Transcript_45745/m.76367 type:complete len:221 (+) Transcript_45745:418-1080(+)